MDVGSNSSNFIKTSCSLHSEVSDFNVQACSWIQKWYVYQVFVVAGVIPNITIMGSV